MSWKKIVIFCLVFIFTLSGMSGVAAPETTGLKNPAKTGVTPAALETTAASAILYDPLSGKSLWEKEPNNRLPMASVTKSWPVKTPGRWAVHKSIWSLVKR